VSTATLEELHGPLVLLGGRAAPERAEIPPAAGTWIPRPRVEPILTRCQLANHDASLPFSGMDNLVLIGKQQRYRCYLYVAGMRDALG
jgi:hypothetical protein